MLRNGAHAADELVRKRRHAITRARVTAGRRATRLSGAKHVLRNRLMRITSCFIVSWLVTMP